MEGVAYGWGWEELDEGGGELTYRNYRNLKLGMGGVGRERERERGVGLGGE